MNTPDTKELEIAAQARLDRSTAPDLPMEVHTPDGAVYRTRDSREAIIEAQLREHLRRRTARGRDPMVAHMLGFFAGDAATARAS